MSNGFLTYDNLIYPAGSPPTASDYPIHGGIFIAFVVAAVLVGLARKWAVSTWILALLASIVPLGSVIFVIWADRTARLEVGGLVLVSQPVRAVPETT